MNLLPGYLVTHMPFRTIVISTHAKIEYSDNCLIYKTAEENKRLLMEEIHTVIIESTAVAITSALLIELSKRNICCIFCDERHNPQSILMSLYSDTSNAKKINTQIRWDAGFIKRLWQAIVIQKINHQQRLLIKSKKIDAADKLAHFQNEVEIDDLTNREGHAAKVYFNQVFYEGFTRNEENTINAALNYGYTILLSQFTRIIVMRGYLTQIGIHHKNEFNPYNLSCDFIEPFRPMVDEKVKCLKPEMDFKEKMLELLSDIVQIDGKKQTLINALFIYVDSLFAALEENKLSLVKFPELYEL
jgi:CRISPR-associated endonuclease Cas1 subtype II